MKPLTMENLMDLEVQTLSGGELQRVAIVLALGKPADVSLSFKYLKYILMKTRNKSLKIFSGLSYR